MAGLGRKVFTAGEVLTAANVQGYLADQAVMRFASSAARATAIGTATEGMMAYLDDTNEVQQYNGTSWEGLVTTTNVGSLAPQGNAVINGGFDIWQRGTSFTNTSSLIYGADRWGTYRAGFATGASTSRQASGRTGSQYCARIQRDSGNTSTAGIRFAHALETVSSIPLMGETVTFSFYARRGANFSDGSSQIVATVFTGTGTDQTLWAGLSNPVPTATNAVLTTNWQRFTVTALLSSSATQIGVEFSYNPTGTAGAADYFEITGVQLEAGTVATPFKLHTESVASELVACQRYFQIVGYGAGGVNENATYQAFSSVLPVQMRATPTGGLFSTTQIWQDWGIGIRTQEILSIWGASLSKTGWFFETNTESSGQSTLKFIALLSNNFSLTAEL